MNGVKNYFKINHYPLDIFRYPQE